MSPFLIPRIKDQIAKALGLPSSSDAIRKEKFNRLTGDSWDAPPDRFCREEEKINPRLIGRFYGENNLKKGALEIKRQDDGRLVLRCAYKTRSRSSWSDKTKAQELNSYVSTIAKGNSIGTKNGLNFRRGPDGRYYLGYKNNMEIIMKKI